MCLRLIGLDGLDGAGLPSPGMVDEQLGVYTEQAVEELFVRKGQTGQLAHGVDAVGCKALDYAPPHTPEIGERTVVP